MCNQTFELCSMIKNVQWNTIRRQPQSIQTIFKVSFKTIVTKFYNIDWVLKIFAQNHQDLTNFDHFWKIWSNISSKIMIQHRDEMGDPSTRKVSVNAMGEVHEESAKKMHSSNNFNFNLVRPLNFNKNHISARQFLIFSINYFIRWKCTR